MTDDIEHRSQTRASVQQAIVVYDVFRQRELGHLVNIHEEGLMIIGPGKVRENCIYQMELRFSELIDGKEKLPLGAECLWVKETGGGGQFWAGFHIVDLAERDLNSILLLASSSSPTN